MLLCKITSVDRNYRLFLYIVLFFKLGNIFFMRSNNESFYETNYMSNIDERISIYYRLIKIVVSPKSSPVTRSSISVEKVQRIFFL